jgi:hypothetical protein
MIIQDFSLKCSVLICAVVLNLHTNSHNGLYKVEIDHAEPNQGLHCPNVISAGKREHKYPVALYAIYIMADNVAKVTHVSIPNAIMQSSANLKLKLINHAAKMNCNAARKFEVFLRKHLKGEKTKGQGDKCIQPNISERPRHSHLQEHGTIQPVFLNRKLWSANYK